MIHHTNDREALPLLSLNGDESTNQSGQGILTFEHNDPRLSPAIREFINLLGWRGGCDYWVIPSREHAIATIRPVLDRDGLWIIERAVLRHDGAIELDCISTVRWFYRSDAVKVAISTCLAVGGSFHA